MDEDEGEDFGGAHGKGGGDRGSVWCCFVGAEDAASSSPPSLPPRGRGGSMSVSRALRLFEPRAAAVGWLDVFHVRVN